MSAGSVNIIYFFRGITNLLPAAYRKKMPWLMLLILISSAVDVLSIMSLVPYLVISGRPGLALTNPLLQKITGLLPGGQGDYLPVSLLLVILVIFLVKNVLGLVLVHTQTRFAFKAATAISKKQTLKYFSLDYISFRRNDSHEIVNNSMVLPTAYAQGILNPFFSIIGELAVLIIIITGIILYQPSMTFIIVLFLLPVIFFSFMTVKRKVRRLGRERNQLQPKTYGELHQAVNGYVELRVFARTAYFLNKFFGKQYELHGKQILIHTYHSVPSRIVELSFLIGLLLISTYILYMGNSLGLFISLSVLAAAVYRIIPSINRIMGYSLQIRSQQHILEILSANHHPMPVTSADNLDFNEKISLKDVHFSYPDKPDKVLAGFDFEISKGEMIGIAGKSGSGKSTLLYMIMGLIEADKGKMLVDGNQLDRGKTTAWLKNIALVKQNNLLINDTISENVMWGDEMNSENLEKLNISIQNAALDKLVNEMASGVETIIGEAGNTLSDGQKQRLAFARALYKNPSLLILDEATNSIDQETEKYILDKLLELNKLGTTIIVVSHKPDTLRFCKKIYELTDGTIRQVDKFHLPDMSDPNQMKN